MKETPSLIDSEVFLAFSTYATVVVLKMMLMSPMTGYFRFTRKRDSNRTAMAELTHMIDSEVFLAFSTYATVVVLKMMLMSPMTAYFRFTRKCFANMEDTGMAKTPEDKKRMLRVDPDVERVRRCHQNDLENIIPFVVVGLLYTLTGPDLSTALLHFWVFVGSRLFHTVAYILPLPQPSRGLAWMVGMGATFSMAYRVLSSTHL